jgi:hypothetical protein
VPGPNPKPKHCIAADLSPDFQHLSAVGSVVQRGWRSGQATRATYSRCLRRIEVPALDGPHADIAANDHISPARSIFSDAGSTCRHLFCCALTR